MERNEKPLVYSIGGNGLVGSRITELLSSSYTFQSVGTAQGIDITNAQTLSILSNPDQKGIVLLLAAKADVDGCEQEKELGDASEAWKINVIGTQNVIEACKKGNKKLIYISTDFVFNGRNTPENGYTEESNPDPINWYGQTKYEGEKKIREANIDYLILRIAYPYRKTFSKKNDFLHAILNRLSQRLPLAGVTDHVMTPTFVDDIASAIDTLIQHDKNGIYHITGNDYITPYDAIKTIAQVFQMDATSVTTTQRETYFHGKAQRPFNLSMNSGRIEKLGVKMSTFIAGLEAVKRQESI